GWYQRRQAIRHLRALPDYLLEDIGIQRHEIEAMIKASRVQKTEGMKPVGGFALKLTKPLRYSEAV
ncbi:MAG: DUF1127 domain-containing protein, partial [Gammaproteobacteria bacterium]|nr:DUF1127 domain-containing protein [Gammaproteobacteria bacterium]